MSSPRPDDDIRLADELFGYKPKPRPQNADVTPLLDRMQGGTFQQESSGNYQVRRNARTGAVGGFQVLPSNIPAWTKTYLGRSLTPEEFERDPSAQDKVFRGEMGRYLKRAKARGVDDDTAIRMAAAQWYGGEDDIDSYDNPKRFRPNEPSFREYTTSVLKRSTPRPSITQGLDDIDKLFGYGTTQPVTQGLEDIDALFGYQPQQNVPQNNVVPESLATIEAQAKAAMDMKVPNRAGVLTTSQEQNGVFGNLPDFQAVPLDDGKTFWAYKPKAKKLKLRTPQDIDTFFRTNKDAVQKYTGTAVNVGDDTGKGNVVLTTDPHGVELSAKIVDSPEAARKQAQLDREAFPGSQQRIVDAGQVVQKRQDDDVNARYADYLKRTKQPDSQKARDEFNEIARAEFEASKIEGVARASEAVKGGGSLKEYDTRQAEVQAQFDAARLKDPTLTPERFNAERQKASRDEWAAKNPDVMAWAESQGLDPFDRSTIESWNVEQQAIAEQKNFDANEANRQKFNKGLEAKQPKTVAGKAVPQQQPVQPTKEPSERKYSDSSISFRYETDDPLTEERERIVDALTKELNVSADVVNTFLDKYGFDENETPTDRMAQKKAGVMQTRKIPASVKQQIVAQDAQNKARQAKAKETYDQYVSELQPDEPSSLAAIRTRFDLGLMSPDEFLAAVDREKELARQIANETSSYQQLGPNKDENHRELARLEKQKASKEAIEAILKDYGSLDAYTKEKERLDKEYAYRPLARPIEFAKNLYGAVPKAAASLLKSADVVLNLNPLKMGYDQVAGRGIKLDETALSQVGDGINKYLESVKNKDLKDDKFVTVFADTLGQVGTQIAAGALTGGATLPTLIGASMGAAGQLDEAKKFNATDEQKIIAAFVGAAAAIPDALLFSKMTGGNATKLVLDFGKSVLARAGVRFGDEVAKKAAREAVEALAVRILQNSTFEGVQEVSENKINDWLALNTYDKSESRRAKLFSFTDDDKWSFIGGIIGGGVSGVVEARLEKMNGDQRSQMMADIQNELVKMHSDKAITTPQFEKANGSLKKYFAKDANIQAEIAQPKDETKVQSLKTPVDETPLVSDKVDKGEDVTTRLTAAVRDVVDTIPEGVIGRGVLNKVADELTQETDPLKLLTAIQRGRTRIANMPNSPEVTNALAPLFDEIQQALQEQGYEVQDLVGKKFDSGMNLGATFVEDNNVPVGQEIIIEVIKPAIYKDGQQVQGAEVLVGKNYSESTEAMAERKAAEQKAEEEARQRKKKEMFPDLQSSESRTSQTDVTPEISAPEVSDVSAKPQNIDIKEERVDTVTTSRKEKAKKLFPERVVEKNDVPKTDVENTAQVVETKGESNIKIADSIDTAEDYGIYKKTFPDGSTWYGVKDPNGAADGAGNVLVATAEDAQNDANRLKKAMQNQQAVDEREQAEEKAANEKKTARQQIEGGNFTLKLPESQLNNGRLQKELDKQYRFADGSIGTRRDQLNRGEFIGKSEEVGENYNRRHFNRLSGEAQDRYMKKVEASKTYYLERPDGTATKVPKIVYDAIEFKTTKAPQAEPTKAVEKELTPNPDLTSKDTATRVRARKAVKEAEIAEKKANATVRSAKAIAVPRSAAKKYSYADEVADQINTPEFKELEAKSATETPSPRTGFTKTQTEYLAKALQNYAKEYPSDAKYAGKGVVKVATPGLFGKSERTERIEPETIAVPDDGVIRITDMQQANRLHQKLTGKPLIGQPKEKTSTPSYRTDYDRVMSRSLKGRPDADALDSDFGAFEAIVPITEYRKQFAGKGRETNLSDKTVRATRINGKDAFTNGHFVLVGKPQAAIREYGRVPDEEVAKLLEQGLKNAKPITPLGFTDNSIVFSNDASVDPHYYDAIVRQYPDATFVGQIQKGDAVETQNAVIVVKNGNDVVGAVMPRQSEGGKAQRFADQPLKSVPDRLYDEKGNIDYENVARRVESGELEIRRLSPEVEQGRIAGGKRNVEASVLVGADEAASQAARSSRGTGVESVTDTARRQENLLEQYAKRNDIWFKQGHFPDRLYIDKGGEANVYQKSDTRVVKLVDYRHIDKSLTPQKFLDNRISLFNYLFPDSAYELMGFMRDDNGKFRFVVTQPFIQAREIKEQSDVDAFMASKGLRRSGKQSYSNDLYEVHDLHEKNVIKANDGTIYVIDAVPKYRPEVLPFEIVEKDTPLRSTPNTETIQQRRNWSNSVTALFDGKRWKNPVRVFDHTPAILKASGVPASSLFITADVAEKLRGTHGLTRQQITNLFDELIDPIMVFDSASQAGSTVVVTQISDYNGDPVIVAIAPNGTLTLESRNKAGRLQRQQTSANVITSAYGRKNYQETFQRWIDEGLLRYRNTEKGRTWWHGHYRLQLPTRHSRDSTSKSKILTQTDFVNTPLFKLRNVEDIDDLERLSKTNDFREVVPMVKSTVQGDKHGENILSLDTNEAAEVVRTALALAYDRERSDESLIEGFFATPSQVKEIRDAVVDIRDAAKEAGVDTKPINDLIKNIDQASKDDGTVRFEVFENARKHETGHQQSRRGALQKALIDRRSGLDELKTGDTPIAKSFRKAFDNWAKHEGRKTTVATATANEIATGAEELAMYIAEGRNFGLSEADALALGVDLQLRYAQARINENPNLTVQGALATFSDTILEPFSEKVYEQTERSNEGNVESEGAGRKGREPSDTGDTGRDGSSTEKGSGRQQEKLRSLPGTLREAGVDARDEAYTTFGNQDAIDAANDLISQLGLEKAIKTVEASTTFDKTHAVMSFMLQRALRNEAAIADQNGDAKHADDLRNRAFELASRHAALATQAGQFTQAAAMVAEAVESVIYHAEKIAQQRGRPLTPVEREKFEQLGIQAENNANDLTRLRKDIRNLKAQIKRLKEAKPRIVGTRVNKRAIVAAREKIPDIQSLIADIKKSLKDAPAKMVAWVDSPLKSVPDTDQAKLAYIGASLMLDKPLSEINREQFAKDIQGIFGSKFDDIMPTVFGESFNLRQQLLIAAKEELAISTLKAEYPDKTDKELKELLADREAERKERRDKGTLAKKLARLYSPEVSKQKQDLIDVINEIADPVVADYAEKIITNEPQSISFRKDRETYRAAMEAIRDAHKVLRDEEVVRKQTILGSEQAVRELEREEFRVRNEKRNNDKAVALAYRRLGENPVMFYGKELLKLLGESRSILASGDLSGSLRQGFYHSVTNPLLNIKGSENLPSSYGTMFKSIINKETYADRMKAIENHPDFDIMKQMGVEFAEAGGGVAEENIRTEYLKNVPGVRTWLEMSERTYAGFLDVQRALWSESVINELRDQGISFADKPEVYKAAGALINIATGRGNIGRGKMKAAIEAFGGVFFAPRFVVSRAQLLGHVMGGMATLPKGVRAIEAKRAARFHTAISLPMLALIAAGIVAVDPDDDDFLKVRVGDKARYEFTGGLQQYVKLISQLGKAVYQYANGEISDKQVKNKFYYSPKNFLVKKLAPVPSYGYAAYTGKEPDTTEFNWLSGIGKRLIPISVREIGGATAEDGLAGTLLTLPTLAGIGVGYYPDKHKKAGVDAMLNAPEMKKATTDDLVELMKLDYDTLEDKAKVANALKKKAISARKSGTLTQAEVDRIKKVLPDFNITARDTKKK